MSCLDTLDHSILLNRLSTWFSISSVSLQWFTLYLSSRTSTVGILPHSSPSSPLACGVPQGSVLGPVLFNLYATPLSSLINASSISHLIYTDDTQLFISFVPKNFSSAISNPQSNITLISSWMSSDYLTLNPSKTEFLLIGFPQQTSKIVNPSLSLPTTKPIMPSLSAKNLGFIFVSTLSFSTQISSFSGSCHYHIRDLRRIRHTLDSTTATTIATARLPSSIHASITVTPFTTVYPSLKLSAFNIFKKWTCTCRYPSSKTFSHLPSASVPSLAQS